MEHEKIRSTDLGIIFMLSNIGITAAVFFLPLLLKARGIDDVAIGFLALPYATALFVANSVFGKLTDIYGRKRFLLLGLISSALTTTFYVLPRTVLVFAFARLFNGISLGIFPAAIVAIASDRRTKMGELSSWRAAGWATGALVNGILAEVFQLEIAFVAGGLLFIVGFSVALVKDTGGRVDSITQLEIRKERPPPNYSIVLTHNWQVYLSVIMRHGSGASIWIYWTLFLQQDLQLNNFQIGIVLAINTTTQAIVMRLFGDRGDPQRMLLLGMFLSAMAFLSFPLTRNFLEICLTQLLLGVSFSFFLVGGLRVSESRGVELGMVGTATGLFEAAFSISQVVGPILAIIVFSRFQTYTSLMYVAGVITLSASVFYWIISLNKSLSIS